jgi:collagen type IV alpha
MALTKITSSGLTGNLTLGNVTITGSLLDSNGSPYSSGSSETGFTGSVGTTGFTGSQGDTGLGFAIAKSYATVAALTADTAPTGISAGQFAIIETGSVDDADNSKLYLWSGTAYSYVTDLSGAAGITGPAGGTGFTGSVGLNGALIGGPNLTGSNIAIVIGPGGQGGTGAASGSDGGNTTVTIGGVTWTAYGGGGGPYQAGQPMPGAFIGTTSGSVGGSAAATSGDDGGTGGGAINGVSSIAAVNVNNGGTGAQAIDYAGLFTALSALSIATTGPGAGNAGSAANTNNGGNATGFGCGGGGASYFGGDGGNGLYGGGGGGAGGYTLAHIGGNGGSGAVVFNFIGAATPYQLVTASSTITVPAGTVGVSMWIVGAGGGGSGTPATDGTSGTGGAAGGLAYVYNASVGIGYTGSTGFTGSIGYTGSGDTGYTGSAGTDGSVGFTGSTGAGFTGSAGTNGADGATGPQGPIGYTGSAGTGGGGGGGSVGYTGSAGIAAIQEFVATAGQDTFTVSGGYTVGSVLVFVNGIQMNNNDYTAGNAVSVITTEPRNSGDVVRVIFNMVSPSININDIKTFSVAMSIALGL